MFGYWCNLCRINLSDLTWKAEKIKKEDILLTLGGTALGCKLLSEEIDPRVDPLSEDNKIVFAVGPAQSVDSFPGNTKWSVVTKCPLSNSFEDGAGTGTWATSFKKAGFDALIIEGKAEKPTWILVRDDEVEFQDASNIWGLDSIETSAHIKSISGDCNISALTIGCAGEALNYAANITCDGISFAGRNGAGAVMGSKNLKAIAASGTNECETADREGLMAWAKSGDFSSCTCPSGCRKRGGKHAKRKTWPEGFDQETISAAGDMCNRAGADALSIGSCVSFILECYESNLLSAEQIGIVPSRGDRETLLFLTDRLLKCEGIGDLFAHGLKAAAAKLGVSVPHDKASGKSAEAQCLSLAYNCSTICKFMLDPSGMTLSDYLVGLEKITGRKLTENEFASFGETAFNILRKLNSVNYLVAGCGGLGCFAVENLIRMDAGNITVCDGDVFGESNLNRQLYATPETIGLNKACVAERRAEALRFGYAFTAVPEMITAENAAELLDGIDIVIDALDNTEARLLLEDECAARGIPLVHGAVGEWNYQVAISMPGSGLLHRLYGSKPAVNTVRTAVATVEACAAAETAEAAKLSAGITSELENKVLFADLSDNTYEIVSLL